MKRNYRPEQLLLIIGLIFLINSCSNKSRPTNGVSKLKFAPPGTNHLVDNIFIDEAEVTNMSWRDYMHWTRMFYGEDSPEYKSTLPDTVVWEKCYADFTIKTQKYWSDLKSMVTVYLRHPKFSHCPVVGITYEQAKEFCAWRTDRVNEVYYIDEHPEVTFPINSSIVIPKKVEFSIPTEEIWEFAAKAGFDTTRFEKNYKKYYFNTSETVLFRKVKNAYEKYIPMIDYEIRPDKYNRYHLFGNVAEMIDTKGIAKGGSYIHSLNDSYFTNRIHYSKPEYWLGFRCICEVL